MSRRKSQASLARPKVADQRFKSVVVEQLIRMLMISGKKQKAYKIVYQALDELHDYCQKKGDVIEAAEPESVEGKEEEAMREDISKKDAYILRVLLNLLQKAGPGLELKHKRFGGNSVPVPVPVAQERKITIALRFIKECARKKISQCKSMEKALAQELIGIANGSAESLNMRDRMMSMAKANAVYQVAGKG